MRNYRPQKRFTSRDNRIEQSIYPPVPKKSERTYVLQATDRREHYIPMNMCSAGYMTVTFSDGKLKTEFTANESDILGLKEEAQGIIDHFTNSKRCSIFRSREDLEDYCLRVRHSEAYCLSTASKVDTKDSRIVSECEWLFKIVCENYTYYLSFMYGKKLSNEFKMYCFENSRLERAEALWKEDFEW